MRQLLRILFILFVMLVASTPATAWRQRQHNYSRYKIKDGINKILEHSLKGKLAHANIGIVVQSMKNGRILYQQNAHHLFTPASVLKLLTAVAALDYLKPDYVFHTQLLSKGKILNHQLQGNLTVKFSGDPELTKQDIHNLFYQLRKKGVRKITGRVFIDNFDYGSVPYPPGWIWDDLSYSFAAPLNTIIIGRNYFVLHLIPKRKRRRPALKSNLPDGVATFSNSLIMVKSLNANCPISIYSSLNNHYKISGCFYRKWKTQSRKLAIRNIIPYTKKLIQLELKKNKIHYTGKIKISRASKGSRVLVQHDSPPLSDIIKQMLKDSDNLTTNAVFKRLGKTYYRSRGTWQNSLRALKQLLSKSVGIDFTSNLVNDGAGLSRYNLLTPMQLSKVLNYAYHKKHIRPALMVALPIAGIDGTMQYRLQSEGRGRRILAKTGTMTGVTSLAGYVKSKHNGTVSFVIMINGFVKPRRPYIALQDQICRLLVNGQPSK